LRNIARNQKKGATDPNILSVNPTGGGDKHELSKSFHIAKKSTASMGKFDNKVRGEDQQVEKGRKRKFTANTGNSTNERENLMKMVKEVEKGTGVLNEKKAAGRLMAGEQGSAGSGKKKQKMAAKAQGKGREARQGMAKDEGRAVSRKPKNQTKAVKKQGDTYSKARVLPGQRPATGKSAKKNGPTGMKGKAKAAPKAAAEPTPAAPKAAAEPKPKADAKKKADGKAAAKPKAKPKPEAEEEKPAAPPKKTNDFSHTFVDDGKGDDWEMSTGKSKKQERSQKKMEEKKAMEAQVLKTVGGKAVPGAAAATNSVPGMPGHKAGSTVDQSLMATPEQIAKIMAAKAPVAEEKPKELLSVAEVKVPEDKVGIVIGPKGSKINMIKEKTDVKSINLEANILRIEGKPEAVALAQQAVQDLIDKGFTSLSYENFKSDVIKVPTNALPDLIGKEGAIIKKIKEETKCEISMPKTSGPPGSGPKRTMVTVAGKAENVEKTKEVINDIVMYYHHEITHPGHVHEELEIEEWNYRFIIGKAGSELRHIEKNYKVRVRIPRDETPNRNVVVVGEKRDVDRGVAYIYNAIAKANEPRGRGASDKAEDFWGPDDDISGDPELSRYLYKRS